MDPEGGGGGAGGPDPLWNCQIINFCHVEIFRQTPSGNLDPFEKIFWIRACPPCGDCSLGKPLLFSPAACYLFIHSPFCIYKAIPWVFPQHCVTKLWSKPAHFHSYAPLYPGPGGPWFQMTSAIQHVHLSFESTRQKLAGTL